MYRHDIQLKCLASVLYTTIRNNICLKQSSISVSGLFFKSPVLSKYLHRKAFFSVKSVYVLLARKHQVIRYSNDFVYFKCLLGVDQRGKCETKTMVFITYLVSSHTLKELPHSPFCIRGHMLFWQIKSEQDIWYTLNVQVITFYWYMKKTINLILQTGILSHNWYKGVIIPIYNNIPYLPKYLSPYNSVILYK